MAKEPHYYDCTGYRYLRHLQQNNVDLYLISCGIQDCPPGHFFGPGTRDKYLIHYVTKGKGTFQVNGTVYQLQTGNYFLICPDVEVTYQADSKDPWSYIWVSFNGVKAPSYLQYAALNQNNPVGFYNQPELFLGYVKNILNARNMTPENELLRESYLRQFLAALISHSKENKCTRQRYDYPYQDYVEQAIYIIEHVDLKNLKVTEIANQIGINRSYLTTCFKRVFHMSTQEYILHYKIEQACILLESTSEPIHEIAASLGYTDSFQFSREFKKQTEMSPREYRKYKLQK